jgi:uronate dehydrogenase
MNPPKRVIITGSQGSLGKILQKGLRGSFTLLCIDKIIGDNKTFITLDLVTEYKKFKKLLKKKDVIIHLARDIFEDYPNENIVPENKTMTENVYRAAVEAGVSRVVIASSVHADDYSNTAAGKYMAVQSESCPDTPYGATKNYIEHLGRFYSKKYGLEVVCIRLGGVNKDNKILFEEDQLYDKVILYKEDFIELMEMCVRVKKIPKKFATFYAVSNTRGRIHSLDNFLNWQPKFPKNE